MWRMISVAMLCLLGFYCSRFLDLCIFFFVVWDLKNPFRFRHIPQ